MADQLLQIQGHAKPKADLPRPPWIRIRLSADPKVEQTRELMRRLELNTVCEEASCPNLSECWADRHATVMILGSVCTRACAFCNVDTGLPDAVDPADIQATLYHCMGLNAETKMYDLSQRAWPISMGEVIRALV